jgi:hypothetical protein
MTTSNTPNRREVAAAVVRAEGGAFGKNSRSAMGHGERRASRISLLIDRPSKQ